MRILLIGSGGREHALLWKLSQDAPSAEFFITRGNGGTAALARPLPLDPTDANGLAAWAEANGVDLAIVGPEAALAEGIVDVFSRRGVPIFGPTRAAAAIETSKAYAKALMARAGVPTARFATFTELRDAEAHIASSEEPLVVKASGLAAGKGAVVCGTRAEAVAAARRMLDERVLGGAGEEIVVEEFMQGEELSIFALCDGEDSLALLPAQDYKRIGEGDTGPNTGGMGACAPVSISGPGLLDRVRREILAPILDAMREDDRPFLGLLYAGLMLTRDGPRVVEFNARFGDPETQVVLPLLASSLLEPMLAIARGDRLRRQHLEWRRAAALTTVLASAGYPAAPETGARVEIPADVASDPDLLLFHAGTAERDGELVTTGGRVLAVTAVAPSLPDAARRSREAAARIEFSGKQFRRDIGWRELERHAGAA